MCNARVELAKATRTSPVVGADDTQEEMRARVRELEEFVQSQVRMESPGGAARGDKRKRPRNTKWSRTL